MNHTGLTSPEEFTTEVIKEWIFNKKAERGWSAQTIRNRLVALSSFFKWLKNEQYLEENPIEKIPKPKVPKRIPKHLTQTEAQDLLEWTENFPFDYRFEKTRAAAIIATFLFTGVRHEELRNLKMNDVDFQSRVVYVRQGKGLKDRMIPINLKLIHYLESYLKDRRRLKKSCPYFFTAMRADAKMGDLVIKRLVKKLQQKSGIRFYPHKLRHTFALLMLEGGCDLFSLSKLMGHSDIKTTTIYLSATKALLQDQVAKFPLR